MKHYNRWRLNGSPVKVSRRYGEGRLKHPSYTIYKGMKQRCYNPANRRYSRYGGRGIKICERWLSINGFSNFIEDMGKRPKGCSIDRIDNNGNYEPNNCRWATPLEQAYNRSTNVFVELDGERMLLRKAVKIKGITLETARWRMRNGRGYDDTNYRYPKVTQRYL